MTKVLRIINRFNLGGISYNVSYLSKYLPETYETLLTGGPEEEGEESDGVDRRKRAHHGCSRGNRERPGGIPRGTRRRRRWPQLDRARRREA